MGALNKTPRTQEDAETTRWYRQIAQQVNGLAESRIGSKTNANTAAPTAGAYAQGDFVPNSTPSELGTAGSKYVIEGWLCVAGGTPGTWVQKRFLTGN